MATIWSPNSTCLRSPPKGLPLTNVESVDLYVGSHSHPVRHPLMARNGKALRSLRQITGSPKSFSARARMDRQGFVCRRARQRAGEGKFSDWSNLVQIHVDAPLELPTLLEVKNVVKGVQLSWRGSGPHYRVFRATADQPPEKLADTDNPSWLDETTHYGTAYRYTIQAFSGELVQSERTEPVSITPADIFPPVVPTGLGAVPVAGSIELAWERNVESDFAGYNVYRSLDNGPFEKIGALVEAPTYSDRQIESGKKYRYTVSSVDRIGNESERSPLVEVTAQ